MTMWFETMTWEEKRYRYLLRTGGTAAAIAAALEKLKEVREKQTMTTLAAKGYSSLDKVTPMYLWSYGNYRYEIEVKPNSYFSECEVLDCSYEEAIRKFEDMVDKATLMQYNNSESVTNGLTYIAELLGGPSLSLLFSPDELSGYFLLFDPMNRQLISPTLRD